MTDVPHITKNQGRALIYLREETRSTESDTLQISELEDRTGWRSRNWTRAWKDLVPRNLLKRDDAGRTTELGLTEQGRVVADKLLEINEALQ